MTVSAPILASLNRLMDAASNDADTARQKAIDLQASATAQDIEATRLEGIVTEYGILIAQSGA